ncbi:uncharacterized protein PITG_00929 [Phytophthora infestans T30-4]|uniref:Uncharacterized protein n=2 Tax=Phytophthora infestans TaxID=4787 RepID=D0MS14_PHYIT|nr:uncharacterized protein PITG_00929 [Phytophthora infestans T30-4]EEY58283.1 conserved hypothetical protein [Phytophthora infestans T30-4]KAF4045076.1 Lysine methyltransferase [Phytophthora infestans]KAF4127161.1 Lysine methyltransferase [Phytophthora infestans]|eukprot:XP_002909469.1 conserved hypothetical protein [Phytophthora infestans T30-4]
MAAAQRTLRFVCGCRNDGTESPTPYQCVTTDVEATRKRQRVDETSIVEVGLVEFIRDLDEANEDNDKYYGLFVWPSALLLSRFVAHEESWLCRDKVVLELGCGTGLPSILAMLCGAAKVYLTDRPDADDIKCNAEANITLNGLDGRAAFIPLPWGDMHVSDEITSIFRTVQVVLAADCFYQSQDFEKVIATVALIFRCSSSPSCKFYFTYQLRSINRSIAPLLSRWGLTARSICKDAYIDDSNELDDSLGQDFDSIYLYEVKLQG